MMVLMRAIYFDTSILRALPFRGIAKVLGPIIKLRKDLTVELWTVDVCARELVGHHVRTSHEALVKLRVVFAATHLYQRTRSELVEPILMSEADVRTHVASELAAAGIGVLPTATVDVSELVDMAIARRPPFDEQGRGFRDALILETITRHAGEHYRDSDVLLASADKDFPTSELKARSERCGARISKIQSVDKIPGTAYGLRRDAVERWFEQLSEVAIELFKRERARYEVDISNLLQPSERFLLKGHRQLMPDDRPPPGDPLFLSFSRLHRIEGFRFGAPSSGSWTDTVAVERADDRSYTSINIEVEFDLLVSKPSLADALQDRTYTLPTGEAPGSVQEPSYRERTSSTETVRRKVPIVVSMLDGAEGLSDLRIEACLV